MTAPYDQFGHKAEISAEHYRVHNGETFISGYFWSESESTAMVADNETVALLIQHGAGMHMITEVIATGTAEVYHYKNVTTGTTGSAGTPVTPVNKNGFSNKTSDATVLWGSTDISGGGYERETILKTNEHHAIFVTNRSGAAAPISITAEWYEPGASS